MPEVSVIMSVYNADNYDILVNSVNSILDQSFKDFEFIICDDGSSNVETRKFLKKINELDYRIKIIGYDQNDRDSSGNEILNTTQAETLSEISDKLFTNAKIMVKSYQKLDSESKKMINATLNVLLKVGKENIKENAKEIEPLNKFGR